MIRIFFLFAVTYSFVLNASTDSYCPLDSTGKKITPPIGYALVTVSTSKVQDILQLQPTEENPYGGKNQIWIAHKDSQGRIVKIESGDHKPSQKVINYELKKRKHALRNSIPIKGEEGPYTVPGIKEAKMALAQPEDFPIRFGSSLEMDFSGGDCRVSKLAERYYDPKSKKNIDKLVFNSNKCDSVRDLYSKLNREINACSDKLSSYEADIISLINSDNNSINSTAIAPGVGGGGGAPVRSIASVSDFSKPNMYNDNYVSMASYLTSGAYGLKSKIYREKDFCNILSPTKSSSDATAIPYPGKSSKQ